MITLMALLTAIFACGARSKVDNTPVASLDLDLYLGNWYEIARFDHSFERGVNYAVAHYMLKDNGMVEVVNSGIRDGEARKSVGKAKLTETPGLLRVSFFGPFYSDYRVLMISSDYRFALVGSGSDKYLWILSRTPEMDGNELAMVLDEARRRGYDTDKLIWVEQDY